VDHHHFGFNTKLTQTKHWAPPAQRFFDWRNFAKKRNKNKNIKKEVRGKKM